MKNIFIFLVFVGSLCIASTKELQRDSDDLSSKPCLLWSFQTQMLRRTAVTGSIVDYPAQTRSFMATGVNGRIGYFSSNGVLKGMYVSQPAGVPSAPVYNSFDSSVYIRVGLDTFRRITDYSTVEWTTSLSSPDISSEVEEFYLSVPSNPLVVSTASFPSNDSLQSSIVIVGGVNTLYAYSGSHRLSSSLVWSFEVSKCLPPLSDVESGSADESAWITTPQFSADSNSVFFTTTCGHVYSLSAVDGSVNFVVKVTPDLDPEFGYEILSPLKYHDSSVLFGSSRNSFNLTTGTSVQEDFVGSLNSKTLSFDWWEQALGPVHDSPLIHESSSSVLFGEGSTFTRRNLNDGSIVWENLLDFQILASPYSPSPQYENPPLYMATLGAIYAFDIDGEKLWEVPGSMTGTPLVQEVEIPEDKRDTDTESVLIITDTNSVFGFADDCNGGCGYDAESTTETTEVTTCSGAGDCKYGQCDCIYGYTGNECQSCDEDFVRTETGCRAESDDDDDDTKAYVGLIIAVSIIAFFGLIVVGWWFYRARHERDGWRREEHL